MKEISLYKDDNGRKVYKVTTTYTVKTEEFVKIAEGDFEQVATHPDVIEAYLGRGTSDKK